MAIDYDLEKIQFLDWISRQFRKDFDDIRTVDTSIKDTFEFTLKSGDEVSIKCKFDDLFSNSITILIYTYTCKQLVIYFSSG